MINWFSLNHHDVTLNIATDDNPLWAKDGKLAQEILDKPLRERPFNKVLRASALLHIWRNPKSDRAEREEARRRAIEILEAFVDWADDGHMKITLAELLGPDHKSLPATDPAGLLLSIALNLLVLAYGAESDAVWLSHLEDIEDRGLLPQIAVRGVFFSDPTTLSNTAELYWVLEDHKSVRALLEAAAVIESNIIPWIRDVASKFYEPGFVTFALSFLSQSNHPQESGPVNVEKE